MHKRTLRFFFDPGAGGCLWACEESIRLGARSGPLDAATFDLDGQISQPAMISLSEETQSLLRRLDEEYASHLNPTYPADPSLWTQARCDRFNDELDQLLLLIRRELDYAFRIDDRQERLNEAPSLPDFLAADPQQKPVL
ncbi:hypothetical protein J2T09_000554 [Neorhizobium huautlense]|uniref:Uncharacterized protein n=1 Tax=Neorhizobium huautlense TaxID=67774 RepID=A0ABT9PMW8_9HYPH|nr:hypothetical protein [Neorhizobium huautlense]MDP9835812.1 hypothetical protein [Neorhizobium huautlense]